MTQYIVSKTIYKWHTYRYLGALNYVGESIIEKKWHSSSLILNDKGSQSVLSMYLPIAMRIQTEMLLCWQNTLLPFSLSAVIAVGHLPPHSPPAPAGSCSAWSVCTDRWLWQATEREKERQTDREERNRQEAMRDLALSTVIYNPTPTNTHIQHKTMIEFLCISLHIITAWPVYRQ